ncbi:MAG TPA: zf-HC2 domain-containing protein, partial [Blastocatellia bacterium]|nr:zf-HC2 domain-containing protein [Blastocatellia bacterium]
MSRCDLVQDHISFYLDGELAIDEKRSFEAHLDDCSACRASVDRERQFLSEVRSAAPLYLAPDDCRERVEGIVSGAPSPYKAPAGLRRRITRFAWGASSSPERRRLPLLAAALVGVVAISVLAWQEIRLKKSRSGVPSTFELMAVDSHLRHLRGQLPLEISSILADDVSRWFVGKVAFSLKLPNFQESSGQEQLYQLEGARLVSFHNDYAAYIAYRMGAQPISLVVTSDTVAPPSRGEEIVSKGITFHYDSINNLKVITWSHQGLSYALVSNLEERGQRSCLVCHQGTHDQDFLEGLSFNA